MNDANTVPQADVLHVEFDPAPIIAAHARQTRRFAQEAATLDEAALATKSRCHKWTVADVLRHLCDVDSWMDDLWNGRFPPLGQFDPNTTPHEFVLKTRDVPDIEIRDRFVTACETMAADVEGSGPERWGAPAFSPLGAVPWWLSALHTFFDSWLHERDCLLPLGSEPPIETEEVTPVLAYILGLAGTFGREELDTVVAGIRLRAGALPVLVTPVGSADESLADLAELADALSGRADLDVALRGADPEVARRLSALARRLEPVD